MCLFIRDSTSTVQGMPLRGSDIWPKPWGPRCIPGEGFSLQAAGTACAKALRRSPVWHRVLVGKGRRGGSGGGGWGGGVKGIDHWQKFGLYPVGEGTL